MKAFEMLVSFVSRQIERMGPHSIRSSTYGLSHDNLNLNYRSCQRAGRIIDFTFVQNALQANIKAMLNTEGLSKHEVVNIAVGERTNLVELWEAIAAAISAALSDVGGLKLPSIADVQKALAGLAPPSKNSV